MKANPNRAVIATLAGQGAGADVVSEGEYSRAISAGVAPKSIVFSGVGKTADEMRQALISGVFQFNIESIEEGRLLAKVAGEMGMCAPSAIRVNPDVDALSHAKISTGAAGNKFGVPYHDAVAAYSELARHSSLNMQGVAVHIGSQLTELAVLEEAFIKLGLLISALRTQGHDITVADLGGGLGISYAPDAPQPPEARDYGEMVRRIAGAWGVRLVFEPRRFLIGGAGVLLAKVIRVKAGTHRPFIILDAGMNDLVRPALYDAWHSIQPLVPHQDTITADIVGPVCETGDTFALKRTIGVVSPGDVVAIGQAGAYCSTMSSTYNSRPLAAEVMVRGSSWGIVRARQEIIEMTASERLPEWL